LEKLVPGIDPSEYGRMPASYYDRSQRAALPKPIDDDLGVEGVESAREGDSSSAQPRSIRPPILTRDRYEGVDSDDDTEEEDSPVDEEEEEDKPQLVGEIEVDMAEEEEEFLEFSRQTLGISEDQWQQILQERRAKGAFVPSYIKKESHPISEDSVPKSRAHTTPESAPAPVSEMVNPNLDSFEAVMRAMDEELVRLRPQKTSTSSHSSSGDNGKGKARAQGVEEGADIETAMDAELKAALEHDEDDEVDLGAEGNIDYNLISNFLESFKSQAGLSGPVSNLAGRLQPGWGLPRDDS